LTRAAVCVLRRGLPPSRANSSGRFRWDLDRACSGPTGVRDRHLCTPSAVPRISISPLGLDLSDVVLDHAVAATENRPGFQTPTLSRKQRACIRRVCERLNFWFSVSGFPKKRACIRRVCERLDFYRGRNGPTTAPQSSTRLNMRGSPGRRPSCSSTSRPWTSFQGDKFWYYSNRDAPISGRIKP
jgi:hypothetical protein